MPADVALGLQHLALDLKSVLSTVTNDQGNSYGVLCMQFNCLFRTKSMTVFQQRCVSDYRSSLVLSGLASNRFGVATANNILRDPTRG